MAKKHNKLTKHHIVPRSRIDVFPSYILEQSKNITMLRDNVHRYLHSLFSNKTPQEQIELMYKINKKVLSKTADELYKELMFMDEYLFYNL